MKVINMKWTRYNSQEEVLALTSDVKIERILVGDEAPYGAAVAWKLSDGRCVKMEVCDLGSGCDTCGHGGGTEYEWYIGTN